MKLAVELADLVGMHELTAAESGVVSLPRYEDEDDEETQDCATFAFTLDGKTYVAIEDPDDGYRSCMREIAVHPLHDPLSNVFPACRVMAFMDENCGSSKSDVLVLRDVKNGKVVLAVGTENTDDYYPSFVGVFTPENMSINEGTPD